MKAIQIINAPSALGLQVDGVALLGTRLLDCRLAGSLGADLPVITVPAPNEGKSPVRDTVTGCLNAQLLYDYTLHLSNVTAGTIAQGRFAFVLGGDCSILTGIAHALRQQGDFGLVFMDAHADFYEPEKSTTGEAADMDLALVTGRGPALLSDINGLGPYVYDKNVIHVGQRDWEETQKYGSQDIKNTAIQCYDLAMIRAEGISNTTAKLKRYLDALPVDGLWIHFDTDVLSDNINPAVDYRIPGGLAFAEAETIIRAVLDTGRAAGISVTIFNPSLDKDGTIAKKITDSLARAFANKNPAVAGPFS